MTHGADEVDNAVGSSSQLSDPNGLTDRQWPFRVLLRVEERHTAGTQCLDLAGLGRELPVPPGGNVAVVDGSEPVEEERT